MATSLENYGTLEYVQDKYSKLWCWKITGDLAIDKISSLTSKAWYGENEHEVIIEDSTESIITERIYRRLNKTLQKDSTESNLQKESAGPAGAAVCDGVAAAPGCEKL